MTELVKFSIDDKIAILMKGHYPKNCFLMDCKSLEKIVWINDSNFRRATLNQKTQKKDLQNFE
ncbi:MAG: hypothetical protein ACE5KT_01295 [Methanosarcinales archaeon]